MGFGKKLKKLTKTVTKPYVTVAKLGTKIIKKVATNPLFGAALSVIPGGGLISMGLNVASTLTAQRKKVTELPPEEQSQVVDAVYQIEQASEQASYMPKSPPPDVSEHVATISRALAPDAPVQIPVHPYTVLEPIPTPSEMDMRLGEYDPSGYMQEGDDPSEAMYTWADAMIAMDDLDNTPILS
jgi:hypothetical protein